MSVSLFIKMMVKAIAIHQIQQCRQTIVAHKMGNLKGINSLLAAQNKRAGARFKSRKIILPAPLTVKT